MRIAVPQRSDLSGSASSVANVPGPGWPATLRAKGMRSGWKSCWRCQREFPSHLFARAFTHERPVRRNQAPPGKLRLQVVIDEFGQINPAQIAIVGVENVACHCLVSLVGTDASSKTSAISTAVVDGLANFRLTAAGTSGRLLGEPGRAGDSGAAVGSRLRAQQPTAAHKRKNTQDQISWRWRRSNAQSVSRVQTGLRTRRPHRRRNLTAACAEAIPPRAR